jgi:proline iminopeptidase
LSLHSNYWNSLQRSNLFAQIAVHVGFGLSMLCVPRTTEFDPALSAIRIGGYAFHAETFGDATLPPLIVVHGGPGADYAYLLSLAALADSYHVLFYDQRGTGLSPREAHPDPSVGGYLCDLDALVGLHGKGAKVRLIGHSWGAMLVTAYLARHPEKVSHAVIAEPGILHRESAKAFVTMLRKHMTVWTKLAALPIFVRAPFVLSEDGHERMDYVVTRIMNGTGGPPYQCPGESMPKGLPKRAGYAVMKATVMPLMKDPSLFQDDLTSGLDRYAANALLLSSRCSFIGYEYQERFHRPYFSSRTEHATLDHTGHNMFTLRPAESLAVIRPFLRRP